MPFTLQPEQLDAIAPFTVACRGTTNLVIERVGPSLRVALGADPTGQDFLSTFQVERPLGVSTAADIRARTDQAFLLRPHAPDLLLRMQAICPADEDRIIFVGSLVVSSEEDMSRLGLSFGDFAVSDPTPDLLILKRSQERNLQDLALLNDELVRSAGELHAANLALGETERRYRALVEQQPLVTYIDELGDEVVSQFTSENVLELTGYPAERWVHEPDFLFKVIHPDDADTVRRAHVAAARAHAPFKADFRLTHGDGHTIWVQAEDRPVCDDEGTPLYRLGYLMDITERRVAADALRAAGTRLETLIGSLQAGVLLEDKHRHVALTNEAFCTLFHIPVAPADLIGADCAGAAEQSKLLTSDPERFVARIDEILAQRQAVYAEEVEFADGRVFERDYVPIVVEGVYGGHLWSYRDVTPRIEARREIEEAHDAAVAASRAKSEFLATVSHEIRTPMHGVLGTIDLLERTALSPEQSELAAMAKGSAGGLLSVINDMLDLQKAETGNMTLEHVPVDVGAVVAAVVDIIRVRSDAKGLRLELEVDDGLPGDLLGDPGRLRQILLNLVANAVKFTDRGSVAVTVRGAELPGQDTALRLEVADTGIGIPHEAQRDIFEPFAQADSSSTRRHDGTGLGLAITRQLVELMGGSIGLQSTPGMGTTVTAVVGLRRGPATGPATPAPAAPAPARTFRGSVLVAEDSHVNREIAIRQLGRLGLTARAVESGAQAVDALEQEHYDLVLMDMRMPGMSGIEATVAIRERERHSGRPRTAIVAMTANAMPEDRVACMEAGMDDFATKPLDVAHLSAVLDRWLRGAAPAVEAPAPTAAAAADDAAAITAALGQLAEDLGPHGAREVVDLWLSDLPGQLEELRVAAWGRDTARLRDGAHTLRSTTAVVGAVTVTALSTEVEQCVRAGEPVEIARVDALVRAAERAVTHVQAWQDASGA